MDVALTRNERNARCRADEYRRKLVSIVGRTASPRYVIHPVELAGYVRVLNIPSDITLWLRVRGRAAFRYTEPKAYRQALDACTPDELSQLWREALAYYPEE